MMPTAPFACHIQSCELLRVSHALAKDGAFVLAAFLDCAARLWSLHRGERIHILRGHKNLYLGLPGSRFKRLAVRVEYFGCPNIRLADEV